MAARQYPILLTDPTFPFRTDLEGESYVADELPNNSRRPVVPKVLYISNVLPSVQGYDSMDTLVPVLPFGAEARFDRIHEFFGDVQGFRHLFSPGYGAAYVLRDGDSEWDSRLALGGNPQFTLAKLRNLTYFFYRNNALYRYNETTRDFFPITMVGITLAGLTGITAASNYLIGFDDSTIYYTSRLEVAEEIDFTPTLGVAGSLQVLAVGGKIICCLPYANGFIVYTQTNAIMASYSGNPNLPFTFREIPGSAGILTEDNVAWDSNIGAHFAWTRSGLQQITPNQASNMMPELLDFIRQRTTEVLIPATGELQRIEGQEELIVKIAVVSHRFLCISYGSQIEDPMDQIFQDCLVFDLDLQRWGRFSLPHVSVFAYTFTGGVSLLSYQDLLDQNTTYEDLEFVRYSELATQDPGGRSLGYRIGALGLRGQITIYERSNMSVPGTAAGELLLGKLNAFPGNATEIQEIRTQTSDLNTVKLYTYLYGDSVAVPTWIKDCVPAPYPGTEGDERFLVRATGKNHSLYLRGRFHLTDANIWLIPVGDR